ncbi:hypothetical protein ETB97_011966 [Aspergillus alliaceus]|uniref:Peroxisomal biogenesis factor 11 n=1 Tax=Petromyces alliaceus TaxID=209559 RepID=A0A5N7CNL6_PETAA|nr:hypothetical protein BDV23DRAFT_144775 [Aspergillus alliaceus]KAF5866414.1 hypothetical protein ETB97_011966 [Aspergillus burnettii]
MANTENPPDSSAPAVTEAPNVGKSASPAGGSPSRPSSLNLAQHQLLAALRATDVTIGRLDKLMTSAYGQERIFAVTGYLTHALHHLLASAPWIALQTRLGLLARLRSKAKQTPPNATSSQSRLLALSALMSETRYSLRLLGLFPLWTWGSATIKSPPSDRIIYTLTLLQVLVNMIYQALENVGFLASKGVISKKLIDRWGGIDKWYIWSTRAWFGHIFFQFFVLWREHVLRKRRMSGEVSKEKQEESLKAELRAWKKSLVNNTCWAPLCLHWCFEKGIGFPDSLSGVVSFMAGAWGVYDLWTATGRS